MSHLIFAGLVGEGKTDIRFLENIVAKALDEIAFRCRGDVEIEVFPLEVPKKGLGFVDHILAASANGLNECGITFLCVHTDADDSTPDNAHQYKINPAKSELSKQDENQYCKLLVPIIPVRMQEAWMLADTDLLKHEIGTQKSDSELGFKKNPEKIANPKKVIESAIQIARQDFPKRRRKDLKIGQIYAPIGGKISLKKLEALPSFKAFQNSLEEVFKELNLL